jgi:hypothetical protein
MSRFATLHAFSEQHSEYKRTVYLINEPELAIVCNSSSAIVLISKTSGYWQRDAYIHPTDFQIMMESLCHDSLL